MTRDPHIVERWDRRWECTYGYEVIRNGWWLEMSDVTDAVPVTVLFAFRSDLTDE